jgi:hypothetical protein
MFGIFLIVGNFCLFAQGSEQINAFSKFKTGVLGGVNFSALSGSSLIIEEKVNLSSNLYLRLSVGYSTINKGEGYMVKTNRFESFGQYQYYATETYTVDEISYDVFPISVGLQYFLLRNTFSPYSLVEVGYNSYTFHTKISDDLIEGQYGTFDQLPQEYKGNPPEISKKGSYRIALGIGTNYQLSSAISLDIRYLYQFNKLIVDTNQILIGINF